MLNYAHQGGAAEMPSSTLVALHRAVEVGADALELDVHCTSDGHLVVCHDATVDATTDGTGRIATMTLSEVQKLDNAYRFGPDDGFPYRGKGHRIATLDEVLEAFPSTFLNLDIKETAPTVDPYEERLAETLRRFGRSDDVIVASFLDGATDAFSSFAPEVSTSAGTMATAMFWRAVQDGDEPPPSRHHALQVPPDYEGTPIVDERFVDAAHHAGLAVHVWTIDDPTEMARLLALGVDGIMTDRPSVLSDVLRAKASPRSGPPAHPDASGE
ncbi:MAG: glycerophosphoryl diester phosphodiesterase [Actinomycetota bacterium]|nr:glycerophosphoryl diester phosphodiesterase [Actinomycetota bacterium]